MNKASKLQAQITELRERKAKLALGGGEDRLEKQRKSGKLTARERIDAFFDANSFQESGRFAGQRCVDFGMAGKDSPADGVVTGVGTVDGRHVNVASQDFTVFGGSAGETHCAKIVDAMRSSLRTGAPFVFFNDSGGARIQEGVYSLAGYGKIFYTNTQLSGVVPQISVICGPCAGGAAYSPALTDFVIMTRQAQMFITGPQVIKQVTGEEISASALGGPAAHIDRSGVAHFVAENDEHAVGICKRLLSFLPSNNTQDPPIVGGSYSLEPDFELDEVIPNDPKKPYDVKEVIRRLVDFGDFLGVQDTFAPNIVVGFGRITGLPVGIVANQPNHMAGVLDIDASDKASRFVRFCNAFNVPLVTLVDTPGYLPGVDQEHRGIIRHGAKLLFAYSATTVPKITVILRKAYGGAYVAMCCKDLDADRVLAWPSAEVAVMGAEGAAEIVFRREIEAAEDKAEARAKLAETYRAKFSTPYTAAAARMVDDVIEPNQTRLEIARTLEGLTTKRTLRPAKKHGLIPL